MKDTEHLMSKRFRGFLPVIVDVETGGFDSAKDALLEIAAVLIGMEPNGHIVRKRTVAHHVTPFPGANIDPKSLEVNGIDPYHPFRLAKDEQTVLQSLFRDVRQELRYTGCNRAVLVGHNATFDLSFLKAAVARNQLKRDPFHPFTCFDTATLAGLACGQTVLSRGVQYIVLKWNTVEAHSAIYYGECTAELFCSIVNRWQDLGGWKAPGSLSSGADPAEAATSL